MTKDSAAGKVVANISAGPQIFYIQKKWIQPMLVALQGTPGNPPYTPPTTGLKDRDDVSGKFSRKVGQNRRALEKIFEIIGDERQALVKIHAEKYPELEVVDGVERPHPQAGKTTPVYQVDQQGQPVFVKDRAGNNTDERAVIPDQYNLSDPMAFQRELREMMDEFIVVECPGFTSDDFNSFTKIAPRLVDPLMDLEVGGATSATPAEQIAALEATGRSYLALAAKMADAAGEAEPEGAAVASGATPEPDEQRGAP